jgi:hypothetical protein
MNRLLLKHRHPLSPRRHRLLLLRVGARQLFRHL